MVRVVAVPQQGIDPKLICLACSATAISKTLCLGWEAMYGMVDDSDICFNYGVALSELGRVEESLVR